MPQRTIIIIAVSALIVFMINVNYTAINLALVTIGKEFDVVLNLLQWVMSAYLLAWGAFAIPGGRICDILGKRNSFCLGLILFLIGSCISGLSSSVFFLIFGRIVMGLGAAIFLPSTYTLIYTSVPFHQYGRVMGLLSASMAFGLVAGSAWGMYIIQAFSWRWIFIANIPVVLLVMGVFLIFVKSDPNEERTSQGDWLGMCMLSVGIVFLILVVNLTSYWGYNDLRVWVFAVLSVVLLTTFWFRDSKVPYQTLPRALLKNKYYLATLKLSFIGSYLFSLIFITLTLFLQTIQNYTTQKSGLIFVAFTLIDGVAGLISGAYMDHLGIKKPFLLGIGVTLIGFIIFSFMTPSSSLGFVLLGLYFLGMGMGILWPSIYAAMFQSVNKSQISTASSLFSMGEILGEACGFVVVTTCLMAGGILRLKVVLTDLGISLQGKQLTAAYELLGRLERTTDDFAVFSPNQLPNIQKALQNAFMFGVTSNMMIGIALCAIMAYLGRQHIPVK